MKKCNFEHLLDESLEKYYWLGFLLADGHFFNNRISITLSKKDKIHLEKLQKFLKIKTLIIKDGIYPTVKIAGMDTNIVKNICDKYKIDKNKTINPPNIFEINGEKLKALCLGIIDGDGSISNFSNRKTAFIRIKMHSNWLNVLNYLFPNKTRITPQGYAETTISDWSSVKNWKIFALSNNIPILERKWDKIDLSHLNKMEKSKMNKKGKSVGGEK